MKNTINKVTAAALKANFDVYFSDYGVVILGGNKICAMTDDGDYNGDINCENKTTMIEKLMELIDSFSDTLIGDAFCDMYYQLIGDGGFTV